MHLKRLEISGFKSFADHIKLEFEPGITAIVGPNGCGKSNIIDAIRWCLGEMSAKSLRSTMMLDVVFNGSGARPQQNMAEVTLTFNNADKKLPIDYTDVSITRRLFRSGESEYFINKTQCRLRDIKELFLDTGMGEDGYSSMEQGKVEWILNAKPEERRELFEEAAGVSKYRARREEAMRKLDRVDIDLSRLADIISVTQDQIRKLENAVTRAKTYQRIREELKVMEIGDWLAQLDSSASDLATLVRRLEQAQKIAESLNTKVHQLEADLAELRLAGTQTEERLLNANQSLSQIEADIKITEERLANAILKEKEQKEQMENIAATIQREKGRLEELRAQEASQNEALQVVLKDGENIEPDFESSKNQHDNTLKNLEEKRDQVKLLRNVILDRAQERARLQQQISRLTSEVSKLESEGENRLKEQRRLAAQISEVEELIGSASSQSEELKRQMASKSITLDELNQKADSLKDTEDSLRQRQLSYSEIIARTSGQIQSIQSQQSQDPYLAGSQALAGANLDGISGPLGQLIQTSDLDRELVTSLIGEHLSDMVADTSEVAERAIEFLKSEKKGRVRIWILDKLPQSPGESQVGNLSTGSKFLNKVQCAPRYKGLLAHLYSSYWIQGSNVYGNAFINGGVDPAHWKSHIFHRLPELKKTLKEREAEKNKIDEDLDKLFNQKTQMTSLRDAALKELEEVRIRLEVTREEQVKMTERVSLHQEEQKVSSLEFDQIRTELERAKQALDEASNLSNQSQDREKEDHAQLELRSQELTELQQLHIAASAELSAKTERHNSYQEKLNWQRSVVAQTQNDIESNLETIKHYEDLAERARNEILAAQSAQEEAQIQTASLLKERGKAQEACSGIQKERVNLANKISEREGKVKSQREKLAEAQTQIQNELLGQATLKNKTEILQQKLYEQYELSIETARTKFQPQAAEPDALDRLKKRVTNIGPVNLAAPQEYEELSAKFNFLTTQKDDLVKAKEDLREVIAKINATTREHFRETFQKVRDNFRNLYSTLFQGGEADLYFTNEADILSTGIDIYCQPPGKKLTHISLLSGGEKALTAGALLFAFFQVRPSPVALLDEVDAPLDDANVTRFVRLIRAFSEKTQFFVITHNKLTMEAGNTLYGVTMEELGVSKVLSTRLLKEKTVAPHPEEPEPVAA